jgi:hypothetical protein
MLSPPPAFHGAQRQKEKKCCQAGVNHDWPGIHDASGEIVHLLEQGEMIQHL